MTDRVDLKLLQVDDGFDIAYTPAGDFETILGFDTAIDMSILSQRRASEDEIPLPQFRRGWIGDLDQDFPIGSKVWLFDQSRRMQSTLTGIQEAAEAGVAWFLEESLVDEIEVVAEFTKDGVLLTISFTIENRPTEIHLFELWKFTGT